MYVHHTLAAPPGPHRLSWPVEGSCCSAEMLFLAAAAGELRGNPRLWRGDAAAAAGFPPGQSVIFVNAY